MSPTAGSTTRSLCATKVGYISMILWSRGVAVASSPNFSGTGMATWISGIRTFILTNSGGF